MSKWLIPRHKPRGIPEWERADRNHGKRVRLKGQNAARRQTERKRKEYLAMRELAANGVEVAKVVLGTCNRKKSLTLERARQCARSAKVETGGRDMYVYECAYCGQYHLTSKPIAGMEYAYDTRRLKICATGD